MTKPKLPKSTSSWSVGGKVEAIKRVKAGRAPFRCSICNEVGHNRHSCRSAEYVEKRLRERIELMQTGNPMEWERISVMTEALQHIAKLQIDGRLSVRAAQARARRARTLAQIALTAWNWGKR